MADRQEKKSGREQITENYERQKQRYLENGYEECQEVISIVKANIMAFVTAGPFAVLEILLWIFIRRKEPAVFSLYDMNYVLLFLLFLASIFVHEVLHGVGWGIWTKQKIKSIYLGIMWAYLTPYCHCKELLTPKCYLCGVLMPFGVLGIGTYILAAVMGSNLLLLLSVYNILCAGGDTTIACMLWKYLGRQDCYILDHPTDCGFVAFVKPL